MLLALWRGEAVTQEWDDDLLRMTRCEPRRSLREVLTRVLGCGIGGWGACCRVCLKAVCPDPAGERSHLRTPAYVKQSAWGMLLHHYHAKACSGMRWGGVGQRPRGSDYLALEWRLEIG